MDGYNDVTIVTVLSENTDVRNIFQTKNEESTARYSDFSFY